MHSPRRRRGDFAWLAMIVAGIGLGASVFMMWPQTETAGPRYVRHITREGITAPPVKVLGAQATLPPAKAKAKRKTEPLRVEPREVAARKPSIVIRPEHGPPFTLVVDD